MTTRGLCLALGALFLSQAQFVSAASSFSCASEMSEAHLKMKFQDALDQLADTSHHMDSEERFKLMLASINAAQNKVKSMDDRELFEALERWADRVHKRGPRGDKDSEATGYFPGLEPEGATASHERLSRIGEGVSQGKNPRSFAELHAQSVARLDPEQANDGPVTSAMHDIFGNFAGAPTADFLKVSNEYFDSLLMALSAKDGIGKVARIFENQDSQFWTLLQFQEYRRRMGEGSFEYTPSSMTPEQREAALRAAKAAGETPAGETPASPYLQQMRRSVNLFDYIGLAK